MGRPMHLGELAPEERNELEKLLDRFEQACRAGTAGDLRDFLPAQDYLSVVALLELVKIDLEVQWRNGRRVLLEDYLARCPELTVVPETWPALLYEEYYVRQRCGDRPPLTQYQERFPGQFAALGRLVREQPQSAGGRPASSGKPPSGPPPGSGKPPSAPPSAFAALCGVNAQEGLEAGGYRFLKRLGSGSFGEVWRGQAPGGVDVAVKVLLRSIDDEDVQREREALDLIKNLRHPFLLQTHQFFQSSDRLVIVMELADCSLHDRLKECVKAGQNGVPLDELLPYVQQACAALDFLHRHQVLHRDIKPANLLLMQRYVKVADMGLARRLEGPDQFTATTAGSYAYMAPEVWRGQAGTASDQYSLAVTYAELRLNRPLFNTRNVAELMLAHVEGQADLAALPPAERQALVRALAKNPADRYPTCAAFAEALQEAVLGRSGRTAPRADPSGRGLAAAPTDKWDAEPGGVGVAVLPEVATARLSAEAETHPSTARPPAMAWRPPLPSAAPRRAGSLLHAAILAVGAGLALGSVAAMIRWYRPPAVAPMLPPGFEPAPGATTEPVRGQPLYSKLVRKLDQGDPTTWVTFLLVVPDDLPPFYMMEHKVTNRLYRRFAETAGPLEGKWELGAVRQEQDLGAAPDKDDWPAFRMTPRDAHRFAVWLGDSPPVLPWKLDLPTAKQWDRASGLSHNHLSPVPEGQEDLLKGFALSGRGPRPVDQYGPDEAVPYGCKNMFSNGYEWTRTKYASDLDADLEGSPDPLRDVSLQWRGRSYLEDNPFQLDSEGHLPDFAGKALEASHETGFRLVLELPRP